MTKCQYFHHCPNHQLFMWFNTTVHKTATRTSSLPTVIRFSHHSHVLDSPHSTGLSSAYSRGHKRCTGRRNSLFFDLTRTTLTRPSWPGYTSITRPSGHSPRLAFGFTISTTSASFKLCLGRNHFLLTVRVGSNSLLQRFQNWPRSCCTRCHCFLGQTGD